MRKSSPFVLLAAVLAASAACHAQTCPVRIDNVNARATLTSQPPDPNPPYLEIAWRNLSGEPISRVLFEVHFPNGLGEFMTYSNTQVNAVDTAVWSDAAFIPAFGGGLPLRVRAEKILFTNGTTWLDDGSNICFAAFGGTQTTSPAPIPGPAQSSQGLAGVPGFGSPVSGAAAPRQTCPITYIAIDPDGEDQGATNAATPFLRIVYRNDSSRAIAGVLFDVNSEDGDVESFPSGHKVGPGKNAHEVWYYHKGESAVVRAWPETIYYEDGTEWQNDRRECLSSNPANWKTAARREVTAHEAQPAPPAAQPAVSASSGTSLFVAPDSSTPAAVGTAISLVTPVQDATIEAAERLKDVLTRALAVSLPLPQHSPCSDLLAVLPTLPSPPLPQLPPRLSCPVTAEYLDVGGQGRVYAGLHNWSGHSVSSVLLDVTDDSTRKVYTFRDDHPLASGRVYDGTWATGSESVSTRTIEIREVDFAGGNRWTEPAGTVCAVTSGAARESAAATTTHSQAAVLHLYASMTSAAAMHATAQTPVDQPAPSFPMVRQASGATTRQQHHAPAESSTREPAVVSGAGVVQAEAAPVVEEATPSAFKRDVPLVAAGKASICTVKSVPAGAEVTLDGKLLGTTPLVFVMLRRPDARNLLIAAPGYTSVQYQVWPDGQAFPMTVWLQKAAQNASVARP